MKNRALFSIRLFKNDTACAQASGCAAAAGCSKRHTPIGNEHLTQSENKHLLTA
ncbi:hypothetical protein [Methanimicrococcus stummii]|uniref:hypothetical protein n=1 Tax=Methanimicrococcus stummii TaxID=3028294 RepID=UPI00292FE61A|nr:hypothetical protein [Methanimicrococcus sp. Es2]